MFDDYNEEKTDEIEPIPLQNISSNTLKRVFEYCSHYIDYKPHPWELRYSDDIDTSEEHGFDADFLKLYDNSENLPELFSIIVATEYLDCKRLLQVCCKKVTYLMKGKDNDEMREFFNIENELTYAEITEIS